MSDHAGPFADPESGREEILRATYEALTEHGFADLSIQRIADATDRSKSTIYHHFDDKDDLLVALTEGMNQYYVDQLLVEPQGDFFETVDRSLDLLLTGETDDGDSVAGLTDPDVGLCYLELRMQALRDPDVRKNVTTLDAQLRAAIASAIEASIENGEIRADVDPDATAALLYAIVEGVMVHQCTTDDDAWVGDLRTALDGLFEQLRPAADATAR